MSREPATDTDVAAWTFHALRCPCKICTLLRAAYVASDTGFLKSYEVSFPDWNGGAVEISAEDPEKAALLVAEAQGVKKFELRYADLRVAVTEAGVEVWRGVVELRSKVHLTAKKDV